MKHFKEGGDHIFEFGEISITRIKLKPNQYMGLVAHFKQMVENEDKSKNGKTLDLLGVIQWFLNLILI